MTTSNQKGKLAELKALASAIEKGYAPSIPAIDCRYDMILEDESRLWRVQVMYADGTPTASSGSVIAKLAYETRQRRKIYTYSADEVDALIVYIPRIDKLCWFPIEVFADKKALCIRIEPPLNAQRTKINMASDYYW